MASQQFCLKWNNHQSNMVTVFDDLLSSEAYVDVTLACEGYNVKAHKMVLSACSPFFQELFKNNPCQHPIVIMKDMKYSDLKAIVKFMYKGEVNVSQDQLSALLKTAESLQIKGLAEVANENGSEKPPPPHPPPAPAPREISRLSQIQQDHERTKNYKLPQRTYSSMPAKRRRRHPSSDMSPHSSTETRNIPVSINNQETNISSQSQFHTESVSANESSSMQCVQSDPHSAGSSMPSSMFPEVKLKCESPDDEPEVIPIPIEQEISRVKSPPNESHDSNSQNYDSSTYSIMDENINTMQSSQGYGNDAEDFNLSQIQDQGSSEQPESIVSQGGELVQYGSANDAAQDLALSYMEPGPNASIGDELSPGPSSLSQDASGISDPRVSGNKTDERTCPICHWIFSNKHNMNVHKSNQHSEQNVVYKCSHCNAKWKHLKNYTRHMMDVHQVGAKYTCSICQRGFRYELVLLRHMKKSHGIEHHFV